MIIKITLSKNEMEFPLVLNRKSRYQGKLAILSKNLEILKKALSLNNN